MFQVESKKGDTVGEEFIKTGAPCALIKKKIEFSSYAEWRSCKVIFEEGLPDI
jgi:hypothetical protein